MAKPKEVDQRWYVVDASGKILGHMAVQIARMLQGKHKPTYVPHLDTGDFVIVVNAEKVRVTGNKLDTKLYRHHTGYIGGLKETTLADVLKKKPEEVIRRAVWGMLPKSTLGKKMFSKLKVYAGAEHPHAAQKPQPIEV